MSTPIISRPASLSMSRSPMFITGKNNLVSTDNMVSMDFDLEVWSGLRTSPPTSPIASLSKPYAVNKTISFEVSNLVKEQFSHDPNIYSTIAWDGAPTDEVLWVNCPGSWSYLNAGAAASGVHTTGTTNAWLALDGWQPFPNVVEQQVTIAILSVARTRYVMTGNYETLAFYNVPYGVDEVEIAWNNGDADQLYGPGGSSTLPVYSLNSNNAVIYLGVGPQNLQDNADIDGTIKPSAHACGDYYDVNLRAEGELVATARYQLQCECRYTPYQVAFVNRYGVMDFCTFYKLSTRTDDFQGENFKRMVYQDGFTAPDTKTGQYKDFNINSRTTLVMNTGFVDEVYGDVMIDILMSEYVYVLEDNGWTRYNPVKGSFDYQKEVNQKLINYSLNFERAFDNRPLIR